LNKNRATYKNAITFFYLDFVFVDIRCGQHNHGRLKIHDSCNCRCEGVVELCVKWFEVFVRFVDIG